MSGQSVSNMLIDWNTRNCGSMSAAYGTIMPLIRKSSQNVLCCSLSLAKLNAANAETNVPITMTLTSTRMVLKNASTMGKLALANSSA